MHLESWAGTSRTPTRSARSSRRPRARARRRRGPKPVRPVLGHGELRAELAGKLRHTDEHPAVGDWVAVAARPTKARDDPGAAAASYRLCARSPGGNEATGCGGERRRRLRRLRPDQNYNVAARALPDARVGERRPARRSPHEGRPCDDVESHAVRGRVRRLRRPVHAVAHRRATASRPCAATAGRSHAALLGSSGVGKSTLVNALSARSYWHAGDPRGRPRPAHHDGPPARAASRRRARARHAGDARAAALGRRVGLEAAFGDVDALAAQCRFADCTHRQGAGLRRARGVDERNVDLERYESWRKLQRELERLERKQDGRARSEARRNGPASAV